MRFRELSPDDATSAAAIEAELFAGDSPWPRDVFAAAIRQPHTFYVGAFGDATDGGTDGELVGYAGLAMLGPRSDPEFEVHTIAVAPAYQGRGLGRELLEQLLYTADLLDGPVFLEVRTDNEPAISLYKSAGFFTLDTRKGYYQPSGADAFSMMRRRKSESEGA